MNAEQQLDNVRRTIRLAEARLAKPTATAITSKQMATLRRLHEQEDRLLRAGAPRSS